MDRRRKRRLIQMRITIGIILAVALAIGIVLVGFRIRTCDVVGNSRHSAEEITNDLIVDFKTSNSLYFCWKYRTPAAEPRTPYLSTVQAKLISPAHVQLIVGEKKVIGSALYGGTYAFFDEEGLVLELAAERQEGVPLILGVDMEEPELYQKLPVSNAAVLRTMLNVSALVQNSGLLADSIEFDENLNMTVSVDNVRIELGQDEYLEEKISNLASIYPRIADQTGILKLSSYTGKSEDVPFEEITTQTAGQGEAGDGNGGETAGDGTDQNADGTGRNADGTGSGENPEGTDGAGTPDGTGENGENADSPEESNGDVRGVEGFMVFDSSGTLRYDARVVGGRVLDAYGNDIPGCSINEDGYVVDAYWNVIDPMTGTLAEG